MLAYGAKWYQSNGINGLATFKGGYWTAFEHSPVDNEERGQRVKHQGLTQRDREPDDGRFLWNQTLVKHCDRIVSEATTTLDDHLFEILGFSLLAPGNKWCLLNSDPCIPLPSCDEYRVQGKCVYDSAEEDEGWSRYRPVVYWPPLLIIRMRKGQTRWQSIATLTTPIRALYSCCG